MDTRVESMVYIFSLLRKAIGLNRQRASFYGLNDLETLILIHLGMSEKLKQKTLCNKFTAPKQTINSAIMNLKDKGFVELVTDMEDKRAKNLILTDKGLRRRSEILLPIDEDNRRMYEDLGGDKIREITESLELLVDSLGKNFNKED
ncbi:MarR family winged helix-turn-helix transcriptional regulator [Anaerococcus tetradius]|jgi:hypothetical protein|uniref:Transcriptional regulator, MarR family n=1 Tax=Anaerococcus tetradius TaxID=33036 RepID=A0A133KCP5_9FIRM|nr:MarR family winged helix-turn-helix transcriptional regulator [Anaerococcus tetradius]KWZ77341.1 transcriptional regulator, MarR family [Anaerococcus tetradius]